jgi:ABC-type branched-subunit amino acid transport system substrate-binding protein
VLQAAAFAGAEDGFRARFERANREGGVNGRQIEMVPCEDDNVDAAQNLQIIRRQVEQDQVFGVMALTAQLNAASGDYLSENQAPYVGWGITVPFCGMRWGFGFNGCVVGSPPEDTVPHAVNQSNLIDAILAASGISAADARIANQGGDDEAGHTGIEGFIDLAERKNVDLVYAEANLPTTGVSDFTPYVQAILAEDPNIVVEYVSFENVGGLAAALRAAGYDGVILNFVAYIPGLLGASPQLAQALDGAYINTQIVPQEEQTPYIHEVENDLTAINAANGTFITFGAALGYASADLMVQLLEAAGPDLNTQTFDQAANGGGFHYTPIAEGGPGDLYYPENHFIPTDCAAIVQVEGTDFVVKEPFACYESIRVR